jgi:spore germination cell wall hydrolase CwlJ-like protein
VLCFNPIKTNADPIPYPQAIAEGYGMQTEPVEEVEQVETNRNYTDEDLYYLSRTIWGEARGEGRQGMLHVGSVILNRVNSGRWGSSIKAVVLARHQFSVWTPGVSPRIRSVNENDPTFRMSVEVAKHILENGSINRYHYFNASSAGRRGTRIGNHFFRG